MQRPAAGRRLSPSVKGRSSYGCGSLCACRYAGRLLPPELASAAGLGRPHTVPVCLSPRSAVQPAGARAGPARAAHSLPCSEIRRRFTPQLTRGACTVVAAVPSGHCEGTERPLH